MPLNTARVVMDQGVYYTANNGSTGVATAAAPTSYSDTAPFLTLQNKTAVSAIGPSIYLDWIRFYETSAGTGGTGMTIKAQLDTTISTGGTLLTPVSSNTISGQASVAAPRLFPTGIAASSAVRVIVGNQTVIPTTTTPLAALTQVTLKFGGADAFQSTVPNGVAVTATFSQNSWAMLPVVISPGWSLSLQCLILGQSVTSSWAFELGWVEF
jgi:hypothetical protein